MKTMKRIILGFCMILVIGSLLVSCAKLTMSFDSQGGTPVPSQNITKGRITKAPSIPQKTGHDFSGWYTDTTFRTEWVFAKTKVTGSTTLYAKWTPKSYTISFNTQSEFVVPSQTVSYGGLVNAPRISERAGYVLSGWYSDPGLKNSWDFSRSTVVANTTLYAKWEVLLLRVSFQSQGGSPIASRSVEYGKIVSGVQTPSRPGYVFSGWYADPAASQPWNLNVDAVMQDTVLYAGWETVINALVYDGNGNTEGESPPAKRYPFGTVVTVMGNIGPLGRSGHIFSGWNTEADGKGVAYWPGETITIGESPVTLFAQWHVPVTTLSAGGFHALYLKLDGSVSAFGNNNNGQLGDGSKTGKRIPTVVAHDIESISAGVGHTLFLDRGSIAWAIGGNNLGQLGDGSNTNRSTAVKILDSIRSVAAGGYHSLFLRKDGSVWSSGNNEDGQLGDGSTDSRKTPVQIMKNGAAQISAGEYHSLVRKQDGTLWAFGWNDYGQLGDGTKNYRTKPVKVMDSVIFVSAGFSHTMVLKQDGSLWAMGYNERGQLGDGSTENRHSPVRIMSDVRTVSAGADHTLVIKTDGSLWAMGGNDYGQLGDGSFEDQYRPVWVMDSVQSACAGNRYSMVLSEDGRLLMIGINEYGQLGDGSATNRKDFVSIL
jgi:uncharacterized repeat protein (TIGR02543 family)